MGPPYGKLPILFPYPTPIRIPKDMGIVWEAYHKGVPLLGVPENPIDQVLLLVGKNGPVLWWWFLGSQGFYVRFWEDSEFLDFFCRSDDDSLSQWLNFKLFGITYLLGKIKFKLFFSGSIG